MGPLLRTTQAQRGCTPRLRQRASHREKVSMAGALWKTAGGQVRVAWRSYPEESVNNRVYARFLEDLLSTRLARVPVIVLHDRGNMHRGEPVEDLDSDFQRLVGFEFLPPYAPELNPVEQLWNWLKYDQLPNFAARDVWHLERIIERTMLPLHTDQPTLRSMLANSPLRW